MASNDRDGEEGADSVSFDALEDEDLPDWATEGTSPTADADADEPVDAASAVDFASGEPGTADATDAVGWSPTATEYGDTGGTSIDPDLDEVDPGALLDEIADEEFPRPGQASARPDRLLLRDLLPNDPSLAVGLGAAILLSVGSLTLLLAAALGTTTAAAIVLGTNLTVGVGAYAIDLFDERR